MVGATDRGGQARSLWGDGEKRGVGGWHTTAGDGGGWGHGAPRVKGGLREVFAAWYTVYGTPVG